MSKFRNIAPKGSRLSYQVRELLDPRNWYREFQYDRQRAKRGFSDRDTWGGGEYVAHVLLDVINHIQTKGHVDLDWSWGQWAKTEEFPTLNSATKAVQAYLDKEEGKDLVHNRMRDKWYAEVKKTKFSKRSAKANALFKRMNERDLRIYKKATRAMAILGEHIFMFWD